MSQYLSEPSSQNRTYLHDLINNLPRNTGMIDVVIAQLVNLLREEFQDFEASYPEGDGTTTEFYFRFPNKNMEVNLPGIFLSSRDSKNYMDSMGFIQSYNKNTGEIIHGMRGEPIIEFDIWARNDREKGIIEGILINFLNSKIVDDTLLFLGIQNIRYVRSTPRGYDQTDRVLQFHTHQIGSDDVFRQVSEFQIDFDHQLVLTTTIQNIGVIKSIIWESEAMNIDDTIHGQFDSQPFKIVIS